MPLQVAALDADSKDRHALDVLAAIREEAHERMRQFHTELEYATEFVALIDERNRG